MGRRKIKRGGKNTKQTVIFLIQLAVLIGILYAFDGDVEAIKRAALSLWPTQTQEVQGAGQQGGALEVHFLSVGKADSMIVQVDGKAMLVDAGMDETYDTVKESLTGLGIEKLDSIVCTHPHNDHIGAMADVIEDFSPEKCYLSPKENTTASYEALMDALEANDVDTYIPVLGETYELGGAKITFVAPVGDDYEELNDWSLVFLLTYQGQTLLFAGDAQTASEGDMMESGAQLRADLLKVGHHGSTTSSSQEFIEAVSPQYAVITCESEDEVAHEVVETLESAGAEVFYTGQGEVVAKVDGGDLTVAYEKEP